MSCSHSKECSDNTNIIKSHANSYYKIIWVNESHGILGYSAFSPRLNVSPEHDVILWENGENDDFGINGLFEI